MSNLKLLGLLILIVALPVSLYLARHPQIFRGRATGNPPMEFFRVGLGNVNLDTDATTGIPVTTDPNVKLRLTYNAGAPAGAVTDNNLCGTSLTDGQTISGNVPVLITGQRPDPAHYLSLQIVSSRLGSFQTMSTQSNILFANVSTATLFQNGQATIECRIQTDPIGGTIISSNQVRVNVAN